MSPKKSGKDTDVKIKLGSTDKEKKQQLMEDIASAKIKVLYFKDQGNKRAWDSWKKIVECLESKLDQLKGK